MYCTVIYGSECSDSAETPSRQAVEFLQILKPYDTNFLRYVWSIKALVVLYANYTKTKIKKNKSIIVYFDTF